MLLADKNRVLFVNEYYKAKDLIRYFDLQDHPARHRIVSSIEDLIGGNRPTEPRIMIDDVEHFNVKKLEDISRMFEIEAVTKVNLYSVGDVTWTHYPGETKDNAQSTS